MKNLLQYRSLNLALLGLVPAPLFSQHPKGEQFFFNVAYTAGHWPLHAPEKEMSVKWEKEALRTKAKPWPWQVINEGK